MNKKLNWLKEAIKLDTELCVVWPFGKDENGYGTIYFLGKSNRSHRVAFHLATGFDLYSPLKVLHSCDNPPCVNNKHLRSGTDADNVKDSILRGRFWSKKKVKCKFGHSLTGDNLYIDLLGRRICKKCRRYTEECSRERQRLCQGYHT